MWEKLSPSGSPGARERAAAVWSNAADGFYILGGRRNGGSGKDMWFYSRQASAAYTLQGSISNAFPMCFIVVLSFSFFCTRGQ